MSAFSVRCVVGAEPDQGRGFQGTRQQKVVIVAFTDKQHLIGILIQDISDAFRAIHSFRFIFCRPGLPHFEARNSHDAPRTDGHIRMTQQVAVDRCVDRVLQCRKFAILSAPVDDLLGTLPIYRSHLVVRNGGDGFPLGVSGRFAFRKNLHSCLLRQFLQLVSVGIVCHGEGCCNQQCRREQSGRIDSDNRTGSMNHTPANSQKRKIVADSFQHCSDLHAAPKLPVLVYDAKRFSEAVLTARSAS